MEERSGDARANGPTAAKTPILFTSPVRGEINSTEHAPHKMTDTWWRNRWRRVNARDRAAWPVAELGEMRCEVCRWIERNAARADAPKV